MLAHIKRTIEFARIIFFKIDSKCGQLK